MFDYGEGLDICIFYCFLFNYFKVYYVKKYFFMGNSVFFKCRDFVKVNGFLVILVFCGYGIGYEFYILLDIVYICKFYLFLMMFLVYKNIYLYLFILSFV